MSKKGNDLIDHFLKVISPYKLDKKDWMYFHGYEAALCGMEVCENVVKALAGSDKFEGHGKEVTPEMEEWYVAWNYLHDFAASRYTKDSKCNIIIKYN